MYPLISILARSVADDLCSLEKEPPRRATPWRMQEHPWMQDMKNKKVNMANFVRQVWGWEE